MKRLTMIFLPLLVAVLVATQATGCIRIRENGEDKLRLAGMEWGSAVLKGNGKIITRTIAAPEFEYLSANRGIEVELQEGIDQITVHADENVMPYVVITCPNGSLGITIDSQIKQVSEATIRVVCPLRPTLRSVQAFSGAEVGHAAANFVVEHEFRIEASSAGEVAFSLTAPRLKVDASSGGEVKGEWVADQLALNASSAAEIKASLSRGSLRVDSSSGSDVELRGVADSAEMSASSGASIEADRLQCRRVEASAASGGDIELFCSEYLRASASSGGSVEYSGPCQTEISRSSGGSVTQNN